VNFPRPVSGLQDTKLLKRGHAIDPEHGRSGKPLFNSKKLVSIPSGETNEAPPSIVQPSEKEQSEPGE
jgi:hypothetical protein